jgi:hypothetical protein
MVLALLQAVLPETQKEKYTGRMGTWRELQTARPRPRPGVAGVTETKKRGDAISSTADGNRVLVSVSPYTTYEMNIQVVDCCPNGLA